MHGAQGVVANISNPGGWFSAAVAPSTTFGGPARIETGPGSPPVVFATGGGLGYRVNAFPSAAFSCSSVAGLYASPICPSYSAIFAAILAAPIWSPQNIGPPR